MKKYPIAIIEKTSITMQAILFNLKPLVETFLQERKSITICTRIHAPVIIPIGRFPRCLGETI